jgi:type IV secretion system protein VirB10
MDEQKDLLSQIGGDPQETGAIPSGNFDPAGGNPAGVEDEKDPGGTGNFTGNIRGNAKGVTRVNKKVKAAVLGTLAVAVGLVFFGVEHHGTAAKPAKAPHTTLGSGALAPDLHLRSAEPATVPGSVTAITGSTSSTGGVGGATQIVSPTISPALNSQAAKELAELKKIQWNSQKQQYTAREDAQTQRYQADVQDSSMAAHADPNMTFAGAPKAKALPVAQRQPTANPDTANPTIGIPPYPQAGGGAGGGKYAQENDQAAKAAFMRKAEKAHNHDYLHQIEKAPLSPFELQAGSIIPATLITAIDSDVPGQIIGQVSQAVYSDINGQLLIPEGTKLVGMYNSGVSYGQNRVQVVWSRMVFPNGHSINMGFEGAGPGGKSGFHDLTNTHFWSIMGDALMYSVLGAVPELASGSNTNTSGGTSVGQALAQSAGQEMAQTGEQFVQKGMNRQPTIHIRTGYQFNVIVSRDMVFPGAYQQ